MRPQDLLSSSYLDGYDRPLLIVDENTIKANVIAFNAAMPEIDINYAVKANPDVNVIRTLMKSGTSFEVASLAEIRILEEADYENQREGLIPFDFNRVLYSNPVRPEEYVIGALKAGVNWFVVDNIAEIEKVERNDRTANFYIRIIVSNENSTFPLTGKFGVTFDEAEVLIRYCAERKLNLKGVTFHVGSQCPNINNWVNGIKDAKKVFALMKHYGITPSFLDLGGGYPIQHCDPIPTIEEIGIKINEEIADLQDFRIVAEPGRYMIATAGHMISRVISINSRSGKRWVYLNAGVFHGMIEPSIDDFKINYSTIHGSDEMVECAIAGPTCDSLDIVTKTQLLPKSLSVGDFLIQHNVGCYTTAYGTDFNGFPCPKMIFVKSR